MGSPAQRAVTSDSDQSQAGVLYTPADAAELLAMPESWLRRKAGQRLIPCTKLGKHLRFSPDDLARITRGRRSSSSDSHRQPPIHLKLPHRLSRLDVWRQQSVHGHGYEPHHNMRRAD